MDFKPNPEIPLEDYYQIKNVTYGHFKRKIKRDIGAERQNLISQHVPNFNLLCVSIVGIFISITAFSYSLFQDQPTKAVLLMLTLFGATYCIVYIKINLNSAYLLISIIKTMNDQWTFNIKLKTLIDSTVDYGEFKEGYQKLRAGFKT